MREGDARHASRPRAACPLSCSSYITHYRPASRTASIKHGSNRWPLLTFHTPLTHVPRSPRGSGWLFHHHRSSSSMLSSSLSSPLASPCAGTRLRSSSCWKRRAPMLPGITMRPGTPLLFRPVDVPGGVGLATGLLSEPLHETPPLAPLEPTQGANSTPLPRPATSELPLPAILALGPMPLPLPPRHPPLISASAASASAAACRYEVP